MDIERIYAYLNAKRPELLHGLTGKLALLILIALVPGGLPLALSAYIYQRSKRALSTAPDHRWHATVPTGESVSANSHSPLEHWERRP